MSSRTGWVALAVTVAACQARPEPNPPGGPDPSLPRPAPVGALAAPATAPAAEPRGIIAPTGTFGIETYRARRAALMKRLNGGAALITQDMAWEDDREGMDFYYLTGIDGEPGASLLLAPAAPIFKETLFLARHDDEGERWNGDRALLPSKAFEVATGIGSLRRDSAMLPGLLNACATYGNLVFVGEYTAPPVEAPKAMEAYGKITSRTYGCKVTDLHDEISRMREVKEPGEIELIKKAVAYTAAGHAAALAAIHPGAREFEVKDAVEDAFRKAGSRHLAYGSIVGSGPNSAVLHYPREDRTMKDGDLLVLDAAGEAELYAADVTRTIPVSGHYSKEQREIVDIVIRAQAAGIAAAHAGATIGEIDLATRKVIEDAGYYDYYIHGCCHFVGLQVHDTGEYAKPLPVNAVITVEPGIYLPQRGFGVRIEDDVLITATGAEVLSAGIPKDPDEIEKIMAARK